MEHCAAAKKAVSDAKALPPFPDPPGRRDWSKILAQAESGNKAVCEPNPADSPAGALSLARVRYSMLEVITIGFDLRYRKAGIEREDRDR